MIPGCSTIADHCSLRLKLLDQVGIVKFLQREMKTFILCSAIGFQPKVTLSANWANLCSGSVHFFFCLDSESHLQTEWIETCWMCGCAAVRWLLRFPLHGSAAVELSVRHRPRVFLAVHQISEAEVCSLRLAGVFSKVTDQISAL